MDSIHHRLMIEISSSLLRISVVTLLILFSTLLFSSIGSAAQIKLTWDANTDSGTAGYKIYYGTESRNYGTPINVGNANTFTLTGLTNGQTYFIVATAYNTSGLEGNFSNEVSGPAKDLETISTPSVLSGPMNATIGNSYTYTTGGSSSNFGDSVEYQFDWKGDASDLSRWGAASQPKVWKTAGTYNIRARARCATHSSVISTWSGTLSVTIDSLTTKPKVSVGATDRIAKEAGLNPGTFRISRKGNTAASLTVYYSVGGTSTYGVDYNPIPTSITIPAGASSASITVTPIDDTLHEGKKTVIITLSPNAAYTVAPRHNTATVTIKDND